MGGDVLILFKSCLSGCSMWRRFAQRMASCQSSFSIFAVFANKKATVFFFKSRMSSVTIFLLFYCHVLSFCRRIPPYMDMHYFFFRQRTRIIGRVCILPLIRGIVCERTQRILRV